MLEVRVIGVALDTSEQHVILLAPVENGDSDGPMMPIWVGAGEATSILLGTGQLPMPRPMTHDLIHSILESLEAEVTSIEITSLEEGTFLAVINLRSKEREHIVDARPSDAIALAMRQGAPIFVSEEVFKEASIEELFEERSADQATDLRDFKQFQEFLDQVNPEDFED